MAEQTPSLAANMARALSSLTRGMTYPSESDYPFEPFWAELPAEEPLTPDSFRKATRVARRYEIALEPANDTLERLIRMWQEVIDETDSTGGPNEYAQYVAIFRTLAIVMDAAMTDLTYAHAGGEDIVRARIFLFGRLPGGRLAGLRSISIET
ncbi:MAG: nuclease A inhibitor family protein [Actinobacteria bacterium]|nr:nuclease A inhibitor family protein [Actinomycetota bacterium]